MECRQKNKLVLQMQTSGLPLEPTRTIYIYICIYIYTHGWVGGGGGGGGAVNKLVY